ncbi:MAG: hypothetical protein PHS79_01265 [Patescibacteria group bacterium]|nr:hypothetical protein [Patescibacteria group bacterium]
MFAKIPLRKRLPILKSFFKPALSPEAYFAYFHRLPDQIKVDWFRDDGMIVGKVLAGDKQFMTQGKDADDFIRMVNMSVVTAFNIPEDYFDIVNQTRTYTPPDTEKVFLGDKSVAGRSFGIAKGERKFKLA